MMSTPQMIEQKRAARAMKCVDDIKKVGDKMKEYGSLARSAPADIQTNGLGHTLAFWRSKGWKGGKAEDNAHTAIFTDVSRWVCERMKWKHNEKRDGLLGWLVEKSTNDYRRATAEAMAFLVWLKRFAEAELE